MATYNRTPFVDIIANASTYIVLVSGVISVSDGLVILEPNSSCKAIISFPSFGDTLKSDTLKVVYSANVQDVDMLSRYNTDFGIDFDLQYYKNRDEDANDPVYVDGEYECNTFYPYYNNERDGYTNQYTVFTTGELIKNINILIYNNTGQSIRLTDLSIYSEPRPVTNIDDVKEIVDEAIPEYQENYGTFIECREDDPINPEVGRIWLRIDLE